MFDFGDFLIGSPSIAAAGQAAPQIVAAYQQGRRDVAATEQALLEMQKAKRLLDIQDLELQQKRELLPLEKLLKMQDVNVAAPEVTEDDIKEASRMVLGDKETYTDEEVEQVQRVAEGLAAQRAPVYDPNDMSTWIEAVSQPGMVKSKLQAEIERYASQQAAQMQRDILKAQFAAERDDRRAEEQMNRTKMIIEAQGKRLAETIKAAGERQDKNIQAADDRLSKNLSFKERMAREKQAEAAAKASEGRLARITNIHASPTGRKALLAEWKKLEKFSDTEAAKSFYSKFANTLSAMGVEPPAGVPHAANYSARAKTRQQVEKQKALPPRYQRGKKYKNGDRVLWIDGSVREVRNGKLVRVK